MIKIIGIVNQSEIPPQKRDGSGNRNGLAEIVRQIASDLPPIGKFIKITHDYPVSSQLLSRVQNITDRAKLPPIKVIVRGEFAFIGRKTK